MADEIRFDDAPVPTIALPEGGDVAPDTTHELTCKVCGTELRYGGRGRKPVYCDVHKPSRGGGAKTASVVGSKKNEQLAAQATEALVQYNSLIAMGLMLAQMPATASAIAEREESFRIQTLNALRGDPALCQRILKTGETSAKLMLIVAYGSLAGSVAPYAAAELKEKKEAREAARYEDGA